MHVLSVSYSSLYSCSLLFDLRFFVFDFPVVASAAVTSSVASLVLVGAVSVDVDTAVTARVEFDATTVLARSLIRAFARDYFFFRGCLVLLDAAPFIVLEEDLVADPVV